MRVTVRKQESEQGLARVCQSPRGYVVSVDGKRAGSVSWARERWGRSDGGYWYWYASIGGASYNSSSDTPRAATKEEARDACVAWVKRMATQCMSREQEEP